MKTSTIIRFILSAIFATLGCAVIFEHVPASGLLFSVSWLLLMGRAELTRPIPRSENWLMHLMIVVCILLLLFFGLSHLPEPHGTFRRAAAVVLWLVWMYAIYYRWKREKGQTDA